MYTMDMGPPSWDTGPTHMQTSCLHLRSLAPKGVGSPGSHQCIQGFRGGTSPVGSRLKSLFPNQPAFSSCVP